MRVLGPDANALAERNADGRLPGGEPCEGEPHARFWEGVLETAPDVHGDGLSPCVGNPQDHGGRAYRLRKPRQRPTPPFKVWSGTGETRLCSLVSKDRSYKPMAKSSGAQRESGGVVVAETAHKGAVRRKGPDFGHAGGGGKRQGMAGTTRPKSPRGHEPMDNVRKLQRRLYVAAKRSPESIRSAPSRRSAAR
jgi:hypothetical protein